jgi:TetR/AcrR family transcriptional repressor of nem operon
MECTTLPLTEVSRGPGRPREFDIDEALDNAALIFSERGYNATSINDLTDGMQLAAGSIYKAFKDKRGVFLAAFDRNKAVRDDKLRNKLNREATGLDQIREVLTFFMEASHGANGKRGCLVVSSAVELSTSDDQVARRVLAAFDKVEALMVDLITQGQIDGSVPSHIDRQATARLMLCILQGMRLLGKTGRKRHEMAEMVEVAMKALA